MCWHWDGSQGGVATKGKRRVAATAAAIGDASIPPYCSHLERHGNCKVGADCRFRHCSTPPTAGDVRAITQGAPAHRLALTATVAGVASADACQSASNGAWCAPSVLECLKYSEIIKSCIVVGIAAAISYRFHKVWRASSYAPERSETKDKYPPAACPSKARATARRSA